MPATAASAAPDHEGHGDGAVDVDAEQRRHGLVLLAGAHVAAEPRARYQPGEQRQQHDRGDDDDDLDVGKLHHEAAGALMQGMAAGDDRRHRLDARAPWATCEKLVSTNDMPIAESIGARRNECRSGR